MAVNYTFHQGDLIKLDLQVDRGSDFTAWKLQWDSYRSLSGLAEQGAAKQVQALTLCFSRDTLSIVQNLGLTEEQRGSVNDIISTIKQVMWTRRLSAGTFADVRNKLVSHLMISSCLSVSWWKHVTSVMMLVPRKTSRTR